MSGARVELEGRGDPWVVPVPGLPSLQQRELAPDLRRAMHLAFVAPRSAPTLEDLVDDLEEARACLEAERVHVLGVSSWGLLAAHWAHVRPDSVAGVVVVGTPPSLAGLEEAQEAHWQRADPERRRILDENLARLPAADGRDAILARLRAYAPMAYADPRFDPTAGLGDLDWGAATTFRAEVAPRLAEIDGPATLATLACPVLHVHGRYDGIVPLALWGPAPAGVERRVFEASGHHPHQEEPERFARELLAWTGAADAKGSRPV